MKTLKYITISIVLTAVIYVFFAAESNSYDFRTWNETAKILFVICTCVLDLVLIDLHRTKSKTVA